jgi:hypothetical protein
MKDREWCKKIEDEINGLKNRVGKLDGGTGEFEPHQKIIELDIEWPEADIGGLHFNTQKTHGIFDLKEDGNYYSRDILFLSARDTDEGTVRDLLSEYLDSEAVKEAFMAAIGKHGRVFIPEENQGIKTYNGVRWWYWLRPPYSASAADFCGVGDTGYATNGLASSVGGCAPAFCVGDNRHE